MTYELLTALATFAFVTSITPGPNNLMLMTSGANFGFRRTIPHMLGVGLGFVIMVILVGAGLVSVFDAYPVSYTVLKVFSVVYLLYLAWKIANSSAPGEAGGAASPMTFLQAALFQWINPKAWAMALTAVTVYAPSQSLAAIGLVALVFGLVNLPSVGSWTILGQQMRRFLTDPLQLRVFNISMALLLVASLAPMLF
ncbi:MAG: LysE family translocator [Pseudomonadota bacterium]